MERPQGLRTWIEVSKANLKHNIGVFRGLLKPETKLMAIVKSNAYGHGLVDFSKAAEGLGVDWFGVDSIVEALRLRQQRITKPILVLGYTLPELVADAVKSDIAITASSFDALEKWVVLNLNQKITIHVKVDTGLHRQGFLPEEKDKVVQFLKDHAAQFNVAGLYTHFAAAKDPDDRTYTEKQISEFKKWIEAFHAAGFQPLTHADASAGAVLYPEAHCDLVRVGAGLYGFAPSAATATYLAAKSLALKPILTWRTIISEIKKLPKGAGIGYDLSETLMRDSIIAICPAGYWHGFPRSLSSKGEVLVRGKRAKVLGRVAMDMIVIDITDIPQAEVLDWATLIGSDAGDGITIGSFAERAGTTTYQALTSLNPLIQKFYI